MCEYKYLTKNIKNESEICDLEKRFNWDSILKVEGYKFQKDVDGFCLFHSSNQDFKSKNEFETCLAEYIKYCNNNKGVEFIDLRGLVLSSDTEFILKDLTLTKEINLCNMRSLCQFTIIDCHFHGDLHMDQSIFTNIFNLENTVFSGNFFSIGGSVFNKNVNLSNVTFHDYFDISGANFMSQVNINPVKFYGRTIFDNAAFRGINSFCFFSFENKGIVEFNETVFDGEIQFENCEFNEDVTFCNTKFNMPLYFASPQINASVTFTGLDESSKIFSSSVEMTISENNFSNTGQLIFEYANLIHLDGKTKSKLAYLKSQRRIVLGEGTIVFRFSFAEHYPYTELNEFLLTDLISKIKQYFDYELNKHFEFVMHKEDEQIVITFYTDEYTNSEDFRNDKFKTVNTLLSTPPIDGNKISEYIRKGITEVVNNSLNEILLKELSPEVITKNLSVENLAIYLSNSTINEIKAKQLQIPEVANTNIYVGILQLENDPVFNLNNHQFEELKNKLVNDPFTNQELDFIKNHLSDIKQNTQATPVSFKRELTEFLLEKGINVSDNLIANALFLILSKLVFGI